MKQLIVVIGLAVSLAVACLAQAWRAEHHESLLVAPAATDVKYVEWPSGPDELTYVVKEPYPASDFREFLSQQLERKGWKAHQSASGWMTSGIAGTASAAYRWMASWIDESEEHGVVYMLDYTDGNLRKLHVQATYSPGRLVPHQPEQRKPSLSHAPAEYQKNHPTEYQKTDNVSQQIANLKNPDTAIRQNAADALGKFKDPRVVEPLIAALTDKDGGVRASAAGALGALRDRRATEPLIALLKINVQMSVSMALGTSKIPPPSRP